MTAVFPIFRIFDYDKAIEFYVNWLGFRVDWEDRPGDAPIYMQVTGLGVSLHLSEHSGDCSPGARIYVEMEGVRELQRSINEKNYKYNHPGLEETPWGTLCCEVIDPFGNRITFNEKIKG